MSSKRRVYTAAPGIAPTPAGAPGLPQQTNPIEQPPPPSFVPTYAATQPAPTSGPSSYVGTNAPPATISASTLANGVPTSQMAYSAPTINSAYQCPKTFLRLTTNAIPQTSDLWSKCTLPIGAIVHPMAEDPDFEIPLVDFGAPGIIRCQRCRAYVSPFAKFLEGGRRWQCNICGLLNAVPGDYFASVGANGERVDAHQRPELSSGIVEFLAPAEYMFRPPQPPTYLFLIDVSYYSVLTGILHNTAAAILRVLDYLPGDDRTRVGIVTFDSKIHFYDLSQPRPHMQVCCDVSDAFVPPGLEFLVSLKDCKPAVASLLQSLPAMFKDSRDVQSCLGTALRCAFNVMKNIGGKLSLFTTLLPGAANNVNLGPGRLVNRLDSKLLGTDKEVALLKPQEGFYKNFALDCSRQQISVDCFLFATQQYLDVATIGTMSQLTGGQVFFYPEWQPLKDGEKFNRDVERDLTRETGFEAVMRIRCSKGLRVQSHFGNVYLRSSDLIALPNIDADKAFGVQFALSENLTNVPYIYTQTALLYTTSGGERRIRVLNAAIPTTTNLLDVFNTADEDATANLIGKMAIEKSLDTKISDAREAVINKVVDILACYRVISAGKVPSGAAGQLQLPETLRQLPLRVLALVKSDIFRQATDLHPDIRSYVMQVFRTLPVDQSIQFVYPSLYRMWPLEENAGMAAVDEDTGEPTGGIILASPLPNLSAEKLDRNGIFLLDDGQQLLMWIGKSVPAPTLDALFMATNNVNEPTSFSAPGAIWRLKEDAPETPAGRIGFIVEGIRSQHPLFQKLTIWQEGTNAAMDMRFFAQLVEDRTRGVFSYYEFLLQLQKQVVAKVSK